MSTAIQRRRGTTAQHATFTGLVAELTVDTTKNTVVVHDGVTAGGTPLAKYSETVTKDSSTGAANLPSGTTAQRPASPAAGYTRFNTDLTKAEIYNGSAWTSVGGGATGGGADTVLQLNSKTVTTSYSIPSGQNAFSVGPITINSGVAITIPSGSRWVIA